VIGRTSVVIPCYNGQAYLTEALASVREQMRPAREIIVVDDGSAEAVRPPTSWDGPPLRVIRTPNRGLPAARNRGIRESSGEFVALLDVDDAWHPSKLARQEDALAPDPAAVLCFTRIAAKPGWTPFLPPAYPSADASDEQMLIALWKRNFITPSSVLVRRTALEQVGGFDEQMRFCEDWELWSRLLAAGRFVQIDEPLCWYRKHANQMSKQARAMAEYRRLARERLRALHGRRLEQAGISLSEQARYAREEDRLDCLFPFYIGQLGAARRLLWEYLFRVGFDRQVLRCALLSLLPRRLLNCFRSELVVP